MSKKAKVVESVIDNRTKRIAIRGGQGKGAEIWAHQYWPASAPSADAMYSALQNTIESLESDGYTVTWLTEVD